MEMLQDMQVIFARWMIFIRLLYRGRIHVKVILIYSARAAVKHGTIFLWNREREGERGITNGMHFMV
jgi:hypothetical protein